MLLYLMMYIILAYVILFAALSNVVGLHNALFLHLIFENAPLSCFFLVCWHIVCLFRVLSFIMHSAFNLLILPNSMFTSFFLFFYERALFSLERHHFEITIIITIIIMLRSRNSQWIPACRSELFVMKFSSKCLSMRKGIWKSLRKRR